MPPLWRYVRYTDDGCSIYQCLQCKGSWESRTEPGWYNWYEDVDGPGEGVHGLTSTNPDGSEKVTYYRERETPVYNPHFNFCPVCGIPLEGAIVVHKDNSEMLGPRRWAIEKAVRKRNDTSRYYPKWWWVIQEREVWVNREEPERWTDRLRIDPRKFNSVRIWRELQDIRVQLVSEHSDDLFDISYEARVMRKKHDEFSPMGYVSELHR